MHIDPLSTTVNPLFNPNNLGNIQLKSKGWKISEKDTHLFLEKVLAFLEKIPKHKFHDFFPFLISTPIDFFKLMHTVPYGNLMRAAILLEDDEMMRFLSQYIVDIHLIPETTQNEEVTYLEMAPSLKTAKVIQELGFNIDRQYDGATILIKEVNKKSDADLKKVRLLILAGAEIHSNYRRSAVRAAILREQIPLLKVMIAANTKVDGDRLHETLLFESVSLSKIKAVEFFLRSGANANARNDSKETPLFYVGKNIEMLNLLMACGARATCKDKYNRTTLHAMASKGNAAGIAVLIKDGADVNAANQNGLVPLHHSANDEEITEALLAGGADPNKSSDKGDTPLSLAINFGNLTVVQLLLKAGASTIRDNRADISYLGLSVNKEDIFNLLLANHVDVNEVGQLGHTALMEAARIGSDEAFNRLLNAGANIHLRNREGMTALMYSISKESILKRLITAGADINAQNNLGATALIQAARRRDQHAHYARIARILIDAGAITIMMDNCKKKAWHRAQESGNQAIMDMIMSIRPEKLL